MDQTRYILSESNGYHYEWDEAKAQGQRASEAIRQGRDYSIHYDYWQMRPVKSSINIYKLDEHPDFSVLSCSLPEIGDLMGLPYNLLSRDVTIKERQRDQMTDAPFDFFMKVAARLGSNPEEVLQAMYNERQNMIFVMAMNDAGHTDFDKVRSAIVHSGDKGYPIFSAEAQYAMLSKKEQEITQRPRSERLSSDLRQALEFDGNKAILTISLWTEGNVWFDPKTMMMAGEVKQEQYDASYARLYPIVVPNFTHKNFLQIRRQAQELVKDLGFPEKTRIRW